jgi:hypothetical protein
MLKEARRKHRDDNFHKVYKKILVLQHMLKMLLSWPNALRTTAEDDYSLQFLTEIFVLSEIKDHQLAFRYPYHIS